MAQAILEIRVVRLRRRCLSPGFLSASVAFTQGPCRPAAARFAVRWAVTALAMCPPPSACDSSRVHQAASSS